MKMMSGRGPTSAPFILARGTNNAQSGLSATGVSWGIASRGCDIGHLLGCIRHWGRCKLLGWGRCKLLGSCHGVRHRGRCKLLGGCHCKCHGGRCELLLRSSIGYRGRGKLLWSRGKGHLLRCSKGHWGRGEGHWGWGKGLGSISGGGHILGLHSHSSRGRGSKHHGGGGRGNLHRSRICRGNWAGIGWGHRHRARGSHGNRAGIGWGHLHGAGECGCCIGWHDWGSIGAGQEGRLICWG